MSTPEFCFRCKMKPPEYYCRCCDTFLCLNCDNFIHSLPSKKKHKRNKIRSNSKHNLSKSQRNTTYATSNNFYTRNVITNKDPFKKINKQKINKNKSSFNNIKSSKAKNLIYEDENKQLLCRIKNLTNELSNTKEKLEEEINYLHNNIYETDTKNRTDIMDLNTKNFNGIKQIEGEKDDKINNLQNIINSQNFLIDELKLKVTSLEISLQEKESENERLKHSLKNFNEDRNSIDNFYNDEIKNLKKKHENEKKMMIANFNLENEKMISLLNEEKSKNSQIIEENNTKNEIFITNSNNENNKLRSQIDEFKKLSEQKEKEKNELMQMIEEIKNENEMKDSKIIMLTEQLKNILDENEEIRNKMKKRKRKTSENNKNINKTKRK